MTTPVVHLICGATGAGKTTYAMHLAEELRAVRFSLDEWMGALFWMDLTPPAEPGWAFERVERCTHQIWSLVRQLAGRGMPSVLDFGFVRRRDRTAIAALASRDGLTVKLHFLDVPVPTRWARVEARNAARGSTYQFAIPRTRFDVSEELWEPPDAAELATLGGIRIAPGSAGSDVGGA